MIILWSGRLATSSSMSGNTAARLRSMKLWPPILMTLASGRIRSVGWRPVSAIRASSVSEPLPRAWPSSVRRGWSKGSPLIRGSGEGSGAGQPDAVERVGLDLVGRLGRSPGPQVAHDGGVHGGRDGAAADAGGRVPLGEDGRGVG